MMPGLPRRPLPRTAALYECRIEHRRCTPLRYGFAHRTYLWWVDIDDLPRPPWWLRPLAGFRAADHLGDPAASLRANLTGFLARHGIDLAGGPVRMLTQARVLGHVFNPLTLYWCGPRDGRGPCVVAEVHNTYGERHCYLLRPDGEGRATVPKRFYVSPFFGVDGTYRMRLPEPDARLAVTITLDLPGRPGAFTATLRGRRHPATPATLARAAVRHPWSTAWVSANIRRHGLRLWTRGLPVVPRPAHRPQPGVCPAASDPGGKRS